MPMPLDKLLRIRVHDQLVLAYQSRNLQTSSQLCLCLHKHNNGSLPQINFEKVLDKCPRSIYNSNVKDQSAPPQNILPSINGIIGIIIYLGIKNISCL